MTTSHTRYSIVIATHNRAELLKKGLAALAAQTVPRDLFEVIVVNDGSRDHTDSVVEEFRNQHPDLNCIYLRQENRGVARARNRGIERAKGEIIFFTDDDCVVPPHWIETLADGYGRHPDVAGVGGWYEYPEETQKRRFIQYMAYVFRAVYGGGMEPDEMKNNSYLRNPAGNTSNMSYRTSVLNEAGGFDEAISFVGFVDWEFKKRVSDLGRPLLYLPYYVLHLKPLGARAVMRKFFNRGRGKYHLVKKNPELYRIFFPRFYSAVYIFRTVPHTLKLMALADFFFTRLGWEYQKIEEMSNGCPRYSIAEFPNKLTQTKFRSKLGKYD